ncbi:MAG TPA: glycosyltransferase [Candidatus Saccharimonadales bacterium]|nr:glycosyltransferase [Candidatus Saccharimonadales bacterium]
MAIVCDWLTGYGGAEQVVLELHKLYPNAPIYTSQYDPKELDWFKDADVRTLWLQHLPKKLKKILPVLRYFAFSRLDLSKYDLVLSSSGAEAKAVKTSLDTMHICYCHAPTHYYWMRYEDYMKNPGYGRWDWLGRLGLRLLVGPMRRLDHKAAQRPNYLITNSNFTKSEIKKYYGREADTIYPPVNIGRFKSVDSKYHRESFVAVGRQTPYKRIDLAVSACTKLNLPLTVLGKGPDHQKLVDMAGPSVLFITDAIDEDVAQYMETAKAMIFPGVDDFGIVAVEALAAGTPVIAYKDGGALDYIEDGKNGLFFDEQSVDSLCNVLKTFSNHKFDTDYIAKTASRFSIDTFVNNSKEFIESKL